MHNPQLFNFTEIGKAALARSRSTIGGASPLTKAGGACVSKHLMSPTQNWKSEYKTV